MFAYTHTHTHAHTHIHSNQPPFQPISSFFGGFGFQFGGGGQDHHNRDIPRGGTIYMDLVVSLEDMYNGNFIEVSL